MRLGDLLAAIPGSRLVAGTDDVEITSVQSDSRAVRAGALFCCIPGTTADGHQHAGAAVAAGAVALLTEHAVTDGSWPGVAELRVPVGGARASTAIASALVVGRPADRLTVLGVTGTNGKTTVVHLASEILRSIGTSVQVIGTLTGERTTPVAPELQRMLADAVSVADEAGLPGAVVMEVSSHALDQHRTDQISFDVAVFTNLSHDHLDYHGTMDAYFAAKAKLFDPHVSRIAVIWGESVEGRQLLAERDGQSVEVRFDDAEHIAFGRRGSSFVWRGHPVSIRVLGRNGVIDALLAAEAVLALGHDAEMIARGLTGASGVPGRMELVEGPPEAPQVVVDYAHTPDALASALVEMRRLAGGGKVTVVFGCGGERDQAKRPLMGAVAVAGADSVVITSDNPRHEDPLEIAEAIVSGMHGAGVMVELDRSSAIAHAIRSSGPDDLVLIAGKGHEVTQQIGDVMRDFDDRKVARALLRSTGLEGTTTC